jgi:hypothetical protein
MSLPQEGIIDIMSYDMIKCCTKENFTHSFVNAIYVFCHDDKITRLGITICEKQYLYHSITVNYTVNSSVNLANSA